MKAEGDCPDCNSTLGVRITDDGIPIPDRTIKRLVDKDGNGMYCQACQEYQDPDDIEIVT